MLGSTYKRALGTLAFLSHLKAHSGDGLLNTSNFYLYLDSFPCNSPPHAVVNAGNLAVSGRDQKVTAIHKHRLASD